MVVNNLDVGGLEKVVISLLKNFDPSRVEPYLICLNGPGKLFSELNLPPGNCLVLEKRQTKLGPVSVDFGALREIRRFIAEKRIDLVHAHNAGPLIYAGLAVRGTFPRPTVLYSEHNQIYSASEGAKKKFKFYIRLADRIVAVSHDLERTLERDVRVPRPVQVIHNGIDGQRFRAVSGEAVRAALGIRDDEFLVGTGVVLSKQKGITYLIEAAKRVTEQASDVRFVIAGDGPLRGELEDQASALGHRFRFLGYRGDMPEVIAALDLYVLPSLWEGLPLALCEALAMGKRVLCTSVGGNPEVILDGESGFVVPPKDPEALARCILVAARERAELPKFAARNRERFERCFSVRAMVDAHQTLFDEMLG